MTNNKSKYFKCSVSNVENGFDVGRVCFISFTEEVTLDEAREYVFIDNIKYDDLHIVVDYALDKEVDTFVDIQVDKSRIEKYSLSRLTLEELSEEIKKQKERREKYSQQLQYNMLSNCDWSIQNIEDEIKKR